MSIIFRKNTYFNHLIVGGGPFVFYFFLTYFLFGTTWITNKLLAFKIFLIAKKMNSSTQKGSRVKQFSCIMCGKQFKTKMSLKTHYDSIHEGIRHFCDKCNFKTAYQGNLSKHKKSMHEEGNKYSCDQCGLKFTQLGNLKKHREAIHDGIKYPCDQCDFKAT